MLVFRELAFFTSWINWATSICPDSLSTFVVDADVDLPDGEWARKREDMSAKIFPRVLLPSQYLVDVWFIPMASNPTSLKLS